MSETEVARFEFTDVDPKNDQFVIELRDAAKIEHARRILRGEETEQIRVQGTVVRERKDYNPDWSYHLEPDSIEFFTMSTEVCDATMEYVEEHLDEVGGPFLPGNHWCPWTSNLSREL